MKNDNRVQENLDKIVLNDVKVFHLKQMNKSSLWMGYYTLDNKIYHLNVSAKNNELIYQWIDETPDDFPTKP